MNENSSPSGTTDGSVAETSQSRTSRIIRNAEAMLASGGQSLAQSDATLKHSRALASANASADAREPLSRLCVELAREMAEVNFEPTAEQVKEWQEQLLAAAGVKTEGTTGG